MKKWLILIAIIILATIQTTWPHFLVFFNSKPDLLLVFAVSLIFFLDFKTTLIFASCAGLAKDIFLPQHYALNLIIFAVFSYLVWRISKQISTDNFYVRLAIIATVVFFNNIITGIQVINSGCVITLGIFLRNIILIPVYSTLLAPLIFKLIKKITIN